MKIAILTGNELRHRYLAGTVGSAFEQVLVLLEKKSNVHEKWDVSDGDRKILDAHFAERDASEQKYFGHASDGIPGNARVLEIENGAINAGENASVIREFDPDLILLFGCSLIKEPLLGEYGDKMINLHLGLSPYYKGSGTNFWPFYYDELACVGATIHMATAEVDGGNILLQLRPEVAAEDRIHDMGNKTIIAAAKSLPSLLSAFHRGEVPPEKQDASLGRVFRRKDFSATSILTAWGNIEAGIVKKYMDNYQSENNKFPITELRASK